MNSDIAIQVENLGKRYRIGLAEVRHETFMGALSAWVTSPLRNFRLLRRLSHFSAGENESDIIWALRNVSFEVKQGDVIGIIGRNGAGKSTLLKLLSRITAPSEGRALINGRVNSLLEVGTGFHPELTGRENVYLSAAIHGMRKSEVDTKFDEIVAFAEVERFIDTPVKRYSSGMYTRLAFAVAANLEPEILLIDEVLAVGDIAFQKKCLGKMKDVSQEGRTVFFVSHNMVAVQSLCPRAIWLKDGEVVEDGPGSSVVVHYLESTYDASREHTWPDEDSAPGNELIRLHSLKVLPETVPAESQLSMDTPFRIEVEYWTLVPGCLLHLTLHISNDQGLVAFSTISKSIEHKAGLYRSVCHVPGNLMNSGSHHIDLLAVRDLRRVIFRYEGALAFEICDLREREGGWFGREPGVVQPVLQWDTKRI